jgi:hypothetical protein
MAKKRKAAASTSRPGIRHQDAIFFFSLGLLILVPLAFTSAVYTKYSLPKFVVLVVGASALLLLMAQRPVRIFKRDGARSDSTSLLVRLVSFYFLAVSISTIFGVAALVSLFGSHFNHMGLITLICFFIVFVALIVGIGDSETRLRTVLSVIAATGGLIAAYAVAQSFGIEPFVQRRIYTFPTPEGPLLYHVANRRVCAGHSRLAACGCARRYRAVDRRRCVERNSRGLGRYVCRRNRVCVLCTKRWSGRAAL